MKGRFVAWLKAEFNLSEGTAYNMMQAAENLGDRFVTITNIGPIGALRAGRALHPRGGAPGDRKPRRRR